jgi:uncharacterized protein YigE (DUF2233 family)
VSTRRANPSSSTEPVTFYELATTLRDRLHCPDALYLDGDLSAMSPPSTGESQAIATIIYITRPGR